MTGPRDQTRNDVLHKATEGERLASRHLDLPVARQRFKECKKLRNLFWGRMTYARRLALDAITTVIVAVPAHLPLNRWLPHHCDSSAVKLAAGASILTVADLPVT